MSIPLIATKLYVPRPRAKAVPRQRLMDQLNRGLSGKLTLISAPAGFGKTTVISEWATGTGRPIAWLSLDERDNDIGRFLAYFIAALRTIAPDVGDGLSDALQSPQLPPPETILTALINDISATLEPFLFVLDDYHVIDAAPVNDALDFLLGHLPPQMHLVITTRDDPRLPIARLRARGELSELRASHLRFTPQESADFLNRSMGLSLLADDIAALDERTEGWVAGLQLAALSLDGHRDAAGFIRTFAGDHRYIVDYLVEEVLRRQPAQMRGFLLQTAILDRMTGALCDALTGQHDSSAHLEALERGNVFVVPLDDSRHWFRYHHLFADVLHAHLIAEQPDMIPVLHGRASLWYEQNGATGEAIRHALAAGNFDRAASLIEILAPELRRTRQEAVMLGFIRALPDDTIRRRPVLSVSYAGVLLQNGRVEGTEAWLRDAEAWLRYRRAEAEAAGMVVVDEHEFPALPASIEMYRAAIGLASGDSDGAIRHARQALLVAPQDGHLIHGALTALLGLAYWSRGELDAARRSYVDALAQMQHAGHISDLAGLAIGLGAIQITQGRLHEVMSTYAQTLQRVTAKGGRVLRGAADMHVGLSELYFERDDLDAAMQHLQRSRDMGELAGLPQNPYRQRVALARIREAQGDFSAALDLLDEAQRLYVADLFPNVRPIAAMKARVFIAQGRLGEAAAWARENALSVDDSLSYLREFEHITFARLLLAQGLSGQDDAAFSDAHHLLRRLLSAAEDGERWGSVIEISILLALTAQAAGDIPAALVSLERALSLAEPEGYRRMFIGAGMGALLEKAAKRGIFTAYIRALLRTSGVASSPPVRQRGLIDPLSKRELEVLRLLGSDLDGPELAREFGVSLNTIRTHIKNIYAKLGVNSRRAAVRRAAELDLL